MKEHALSHETVIFQTPESAPRWDDSIRHLIIHDLGAVAADQRLEWIRNDQRERWRKGFRIPIEAYLELPPLAEATQDFVLDLIYSEFLLRQEMGQSPGAEEFVVRFSAFGDRLRRLISVDNALFECNTPRQELASPGPMMIGKYPILNVLAEGGQGVVYRGMHPTLGKEVVIKRGKDHLDTGERDRLLAEGQLLARIDHPNLVRVFDLDFHQGQPFLVMEFVDAMNLEQFRERTPPGPRQAAELVARVARALDVVHQKGITHRDIKPKNILVDDKNEPKLIDFGLAHWRHRYSEAETASGSISGTLAYIAPEQARGDEAAIGPRSDLFGLGGVLYFLLTGGAPYREQNFRDLLHAASQGKWDRAALQKPNIPRRLAAICARALAADPRDRHASGLALARDLEAYLQRPRLIRRACAITAVIAAGCVLAGWFAFRQPEAQPAPKVPEIAKEQEAPLPPSKLSVIVTRGAKGRSFPLEDAIPVVTDEELRLTAQLPARRFGSFFHFSEGQWTLLQQHDAEPAARAVDFPSEAGTRVPLTGKAGTELFLFCARKERPIAVTDLQTMVGDLPELPDLKNELTLFTFNEHELAQAGHRGTLGPAVKGNRPEDVVHRQLERIRAGVRSQCDVFAGVAFVHVGQ